MVTMTIGHHACLLCCLCALVPELMAHGGQYRGPGNVTPPPVQAGGDNAQKPGTPRPGSATPPGGSIVGTAAPAPRGLPIEEDLSRWEYWWEFHKDPLLRLRERLQALPAVASDESLLGASRQPLAADRRAPTAADLVDRVLPALKQALDRSASRDITTGCLVALAKIGRDHPTFQLLRDVFAPYLRSKDQEVRETAALCVGIAGQITPMAVELLTGLALDTAAGRAASDRSAVDDRCRTFATYALGLLARTTTDPALQRTLCQPMLAILQDHAATSRNLKVAAIEALGLLRRQSDSARARFLRDDVLRALRGYFRLDLGPGEQWIQAHCPTVIAKLASPLHEQADELRALFAGDLSGAAESPRTSGPIAESCALALGRLCRPYDDAAAPDRQYAELLLATWRGHRDRQTREFAILALAQVGGARARATLLAEFDNCRAMQDRTWVALALGQFAQRQAEVAATAGHSVEPDQDFGERLDAALMAARNSSVVAALAIALGLCNYQLSADHLRDLLAQSRQNDELAGYLCVALALMDEHRAVADIRAVVERSWRRPALLQQAATALGRLGDKSAADLLAMHLDASDGGLARLSAVASALGQIGDRRSIDPLRGMLLDESLTPLTRAFAAVALGGVGDKADLPWNAVFGSINYRAAVETLTDGTAGILDIF